MIWAAALAALALLGLLGAAALAWQARAERAAVREREAVMNQWATALDERYWQLWRRELALHRAEGNTR